MEKQKYHFASKVSSYDAYSTFDKDTNEMPILKGSKIRKDTTRTYKFSEERSKIIAKNKFKIVDDCYVVTKDITFPSPTKAAGFVTGASTNGRLAWKPVGKSEPIVQLRKKNKTEDSDSQTQNQ